MNKEQLSIEEKARAYDEAYKKVAVRFGSNVADEIFPEFKESEDDRIRKAAIEFVKQNNSFNYCLGISKEEVLDWLEKQAEHAKFRDSIQVGDKVTRNEDGVLVNLSQLERVAKPADTEKGAKGNEVEIPNSAWSEEDESEIDILCHFLEEYGERYYGYIPLQNTISWLKSLKDRYTWKPSEDTPKWRRLPLNGVSYPPDKWCVMDIVTSTVNGNNVTVSALVKGDYYVPLYELDKFINKEK